MSLDNPGTGVDITVGGTEHYFSNVGHYSSSEEVVSVDPADDQAQFGQLTVDVADDPAVKGYGDKTLSLVDGKQGSTLGYIRGLSGDQTKATLTADSRIGQTAVTRRMPPFTGALGDALRAWLASCGVTAGVVVDPALDATPVTLPGWNGVVYDHLKWLCAAHHFEMALVSDNIVFRPLRSRVAVNLRNASVSWTHDATQLAQTVEGYYYGNRWLANALAYPGLGGWNEDVTVYSVDAGEKVELELPIDASLVSVQQPTCLKFVDRMHSTSSVYSVTGSDDLPLEPAQWEAGGGKLTVEIGKDTKTLLVTIIGSSETEYAPYKIAVSAGPSDEYSSLRIVGTGVFTEENLWTLPGHPDPDRAPEELGTTVQNPFFATRDQLHAALGWTALHYAGARQTINVTTKGINRLGDSGVAVAFPTLDELEAMYPTATVDELSAELGPTVADWDAKLYELVKDNFENQAFGNVAGARVLHDDAWYRIRSATIQYDQVTYTAEWDTTIDDAFPGTETVDQWDARWAGKTVNDVTISPLRGINA